MSCRRRRVAEILILLILLVLVCIKSLHSTYSVKLEREARHRVNIGIMKERIRAAGGCGGGSDGGCVTIVVWKREKNRMQIA